MVIIRDKVVKYPVIVLCYAKPTIIYAMVAALQKYKHKQYKYQNKKWVSLSNGMEYGLECGMEWCY